VYSRFSRAKLTHRERTVSDILRLGRKTWENMENTKTAAHGDENSFQRELKAARKSVHDSLERSAALLRNPRHNLSKAHLAKIYNAMTSNYTDGLRALTEVLLAKDRMQLDHKRLPSGVLAHMA